MIPNKETNTVYLSGLLKKPPYNQNCKDLTAILDKHHIRYKFLTDTKDIWCRDYMPIQVNRNKFVLFRYEPSYLNDKKYAHLRSDNQLVCTKNGIPFIYSDINLDGGNVVAWSDKVIISDKIFSENPHYNKDALITEIERLLEAQVIIIPHMEEDMTGHADGMVRFVDEKTILGNDRNSECENWTKEINKVINDKGLSYIDIPFFETPDSAEGIYVNYLEVKNVIILPKFHNAKDEQALKIFKSTFPDRVIEMINYDLVAKDGGVMNCSSWNILE